MRVLYRGWHYYYIISITASNSVKKNPKNRFKCLFSDFGDHLFNFRSPLLTFSLQMVRPKSSFNLSTLLWCRKKNFLEAEFESNFVHQQSVNLNSYLLLPHYACAKINHNLYLGKNISHIPQGKRKLIYEDEQ